jgi:hypothetical protein
MGSLRICDGVYTVSVKGKQQKYDSVVENLERRKGLRSLWTHVYVNFLNYFGILTFVSFILSHVYGCSLDYFAVFLFKGRSQ